MMTILSSPLTSLSPAEALPAEVPNRPCGFLNNPSPGILCYTVTPGGGKASAGGSRQEFSTVIQSTEPEYVIASVIVEVTSAAGERNGPTVNQISPGGIASVVSVATNRLRELKQIKGELQAKATVLSGPALIEAQAKLSALSEEERTFEEVVTKTTAAGQDAGKFQVTGSASPRRCGTFNLDKCGSWIEYNIYVVRRYVGNPIAAYNRAFAVAQDAQNTINRLVASQPVPGSQPSSNAACPPTFSPSSFQGRTGRVAFFNEWNSPVTVVLYHPNNGNVFDRHMVSPGQNNFLGSNIVVGDDWGVCFENKPNSSGVVNNVGITSDYNPNWEGSTLFMIQNPRIR